MQFFRRYRFQFSVRMILVLIALVALIIFGYKRWLSWLNKPVVTTVSRVIGDPSGSLILARGSPMIEISKCPNLEVIFGVKRINYLEIKDCPKLQFVEFLKRTSDDTFDDIMANRTRDELSGLSIRGCPLLRDLKPPSSLSFVWLADLDLGEMDFSFILLVEQMELEKCRLPSRLEFPEGRIKQLIIHDTDSKGLEIHGDVDTLLIRDSSELVKVQLDGRVGKIELQNLPALRELSHLDWYHPNVAAKGCPNLEVSTFKKRVVRLTTTALGDTALLPLKPVLKGKNDAVQKR